jgi:hypothetical protein
MCRHVMKSYVEARNLDLQILKEKYKFGVSENMAEGKIRT